MFRTLNARYSPGFQFVGTSSLSRSPAFGVRTYRTANVSTAFASLIHCTSVMPDVGLTSTNPVVGIAAMYPGSGPSSSRTKITSVCPHGVTPSNW